MESKNVRENTPQLISYWVAQLFDKHEVKHKTSSEEIPKEYDELLLLVEKSGLNIKGKHLNPLDTARIVELLLTLDEKNNFKAPMKIGLCLLEIKKILIEKLSKHSPRICNSNWQEVVKVIDGHKKSLQRGNWYARVKNYAAILI